MTSGSTSSAITKDTTVIQLHAKTHFPIKLVTTNFSIWQRQVRSTLIGLDLLGYIDGTMPTPPTIIDGAANPCHSIWFRQDQSIVGALLGSCSDLVQPIISNVDTARAAWTSLHSAFASASRGRVLSLKSHLGKNPRGNRSIEDYLFDMRSIANELALIQNPISEQDLVVHVLNQVGDEYDAIASAALLRPTSIAFTELGDILKDHERKLKTSDDAKSTLVATANYTQHRTSGRSSPVRRDAPSASSSHYRRGRQAGGGGARFTRQQSTNCHFCDIPGHDVKECRKLTRFLRNHGVSSSPSAHNTMVSSTAGQQWLFDSGSENGGEAPHRG
ncbi:unnamed protein product [Cuscuta campestris]|uniref:Retrotransposon Copia-like N-terminal domain-containing protein n=1 Tax=Cuscuta campestris TaxID=132261 RepID=A0A484KWG1_9ASTE|nr:unnamed protein product [Cuscuta campestris]